MNPTRTSLLSLIAFGCVLVWMTGCSEGPSPEQQRADSTFALAQEKWYNGELQTARELVYQALHLDSTLGRVGRTAEQYRLLGDIHAGLADYDSALSLYTESLTRYRSLADKHAARAVTMQVGSIHRWLNEERKALTMYTEALRLSQVHKDIEGVRELEWGMLPSLRELGDVEGEDKLLANLLDSYVASNNVGMQARVHFEFGLAYMKRGVNDAAVESYLRALTLADQSRDSLLAIASLLKIAVTYAHLGKVQEAFHVYTDGLKRSDQTSGAHELRLEMLIRVGNINLRNRQYAEAMRFYNAALSSAIAAGNKRAEGYIFLQRGHCEFEQAKEAGTKSYEAALDLFTGARFSPGIAYASLSLGVAYQRMNKPAEALALLTTAVERLEEWHEPRNSDDVYADCEESFQLAHQIQPFDGLIEQLLKVGKNEQAFSFMGRRKGKELHELLAGFEIKTRSQYLTEKLGEFRHLHGLRIGAERQLAYALAKGRSDRSVINEIHARLDRTTARLADLGVEISGLDRTFTSAVRPYSLSLGEVQKLLPSGTALLEHALTRRSLYAFLITPSKVSVQVSAVTKDRVQSRVDEYVRLLISRGEQEDSSAASLRVVDRQIGDLTTSLYSMFVRPVENELGGISRLLIVPGSDVASLPFPALSRSPSRRLGPYLIEQYQVSYLASPTALLLQGSPMLRDHDIVALGHPGNTGWDVEYELRDIRAFYREARLYFEQRATLATLQRERGDVLHLAARVDFDGQAPSSTGIILSDGKSFETYRQVLWGEMFSTHPFSTVLLSDLQRDRSTVDPREPHALLMNGSSTVILSVYPPARKTRKFFGELFYTALLSGSTPQAAYRTALTEMIKNPEYAPPHIWAPYLLWGK